MSLGVLISNKYKVSEDRMTAYGTSLTAGYSGDGLRAWKDSGSGKTYFLYANGIPVWEIDASGNIVGTNTFGPTGLLARHAGGADELYTFDPQGNVVQTLDSSGSPTATLLYDAYGSRLSADNAVPFGYGGQSGYYTDPETGLLLLTHRYYDPEEGRFLTRDPIGYSGGINLYAYVENNPANWVDPVGFCREAADELAEMKRIVRDLYQPAGMPRLHVPVVAGAWENFKESTAIPHAGFPNSCGAWQGKIGSAFDRMNDGEGPKYWDVQYRYFLGGVHAWIDVVPKNDFNGTFNRKGYTVDPWMYNDPDFRPID